jgi:hypothetical protein
MDALEERLVAPDRSAVASRATLRARPSSEGDARECRAGVAVAGGFRGKSRTAVQPDERNDPSCRYSPGTGGPRVAAEAREPAVKDREASPFGSGRPADRRDPLFRSPSRRRVARSLELLPNEP